MAYSFAVTQLAYNAVLFFFFLISDIPWIAAAPILLPISAMIAFVSYWGLPDDEQTTRRDHNAPKRAATPYLFWLKENRARITKPGMSVIEVSRHAGAEWDAIEDKSLWERLAAEDKIRYEREMAAYNNNNNNNTTTTTNNNNNNDTNNAAPTVSEEPSRVRARRDPNSPRRPASAYMYWLKENRARITRPGMSVIEVSKQAGREWNAIEDKSMWNEMAADDMKRFETEMAIYNATRYA